MPRGSLAYILLLDELPGVGGGRPTHPIAPGGGGPVDPGWGIEGPVDPGWGVPEGPGGGLHPEHPIAPGGGGDVGIWPSPGRPTHPIAPGGRPGGGGRPDQGLPQPPAGIWPPPSPGHPIVPIPPPGEGGGDAGQLPELPPGSVWPPLPPSATGKFLVLVYVPGYGYKYVVIDAGLKPSHPIAPGGGGAPHPEHPIAPGGEEPHPAPTGRRR